MTFLDSINMLGKISKTVFLSDKLYIESDSATAVLVLITQHEDYNGRKRNVLTLGGLKDMSDYEQVQAGLMTEDQFQLNLTNKDRREAAEAKERRRREWEYLCKEFGTPESK